MAGRSLSGDVGRASLLAISVMLASISQTTNAQETRDTSAAEEDKLPRFTVELIVFTYSDGASAGSEIFVPDPPAVDEYLQEDPERAPNADAEYVFSDVPGEAAGRPGNAPGEAVPAGEAEITGLDANPADVPLRAMIELHLLEPEQYTLDGIYQKLVTLDAYQPIMRTAWTQTTPAEGASPAIQLRALGDPPPGLDGTIKLYQGRFVHLGIDLALAAEGDGVSPYNERRSATDRAIVYGDARVRGDDRAHGDEPPRNDNEPMAGDRVYSDRDYNGRSYGGSNDNTGGFFPEPVRYRISEVRIMKDGEIRYYDHPRFGVIAKLTEVQEDEPADGEASDTGAENALAVGTD